MVPVKSDKEIKGGGARIGFWKAAISNLFIFPFFPFIILWVVEPIVMVWHPERQRLLEMLAKTKTVERISK